MQDAVRDAGCLSGLILGVLSCLGVYSCCDQQYKQQNYQRVVNSRKPFLEANDGKVKILWVYPIYGGKGNNQFRGHHAVVEGYKNKERVEVSVNPGLPVPDEIWTMTLDELGNYRFIQKI